MCSECEKLRELLRNIIDSLCVYDVIHSEMPINYLNERLDEELVTGLALDDLKKIFIASNKPESIKRNAVIHELVHIFHYRKSDYDNLEFEELEELIKKETDDLFIQIYPQRALTNRKK